MFHPLKASPLFWTLFLLVGSGSCVPTKQARVAAVAFTVEDVAKAAAKQSDPTIVRAGMPAYLMLIDGLIEAYPDNEKLLVAGCQAYATYASSFMEDSNREKASAVYARARNYGFRALSGRWDFHKALTGSLDDFARLLQRYEKKDVPALFWTASSWVRWISMNLDDLEALADLPLLEATMHRVLELDEAFYYGGPHLLMATYLAAQPAILGGDSGKAREHFDRAFALGADKVLMARVLYAEYYARRIRDRTLFEHTLNEVLAAPVETVPELTLSNVLAKDKARKLLEKADEYFSEQP